MSTFSFFTSPSKRKYIRDRPVLVGSWGIMIFLISMVISIGLGAVWIDPSVIADAILSFEKENIHHQLIREVRIPRTLTAALVGAALAVAGAIMQGMTRNPLADPSIIGITHGAGLAIAIALAFVSSHSFWTLLVWSFGGAAVGASLVLMFSLVAKERFSPVTITLAGVALSTLFSALSTGIALYYQVAQDVSFWYAGGLSGSKWLHVYLMLPLIATGLILAFSISRSLTLLSMGEDVAKGLGHSTLKARWIGLAAVVLLSGAAVAISGVIGFVGLAVPHIARSIVGHDYRLIIPISAIGGACLLVIADIGARMVNAPFETPVGALTALIGVPFFLYLAREKGRAL